MPTGDNRFTSLSDHLEHLRFYVGKYGVFGAGKVAVGRLWSRAVGENEWLYSMDLRGADVAEEKEMQLLPFKNESELGPDMLADLCQHKSRRSCAKFLQSWFSRGATLWLSVLEDNVVGLQWTVQGGFDGFYSIPIRSDEAIITAVEVFSPYRGKGLYPRMLIQLRHELRKAGFERAYLKVAASNSAMQRSMDKHPCRKVGRVYTRRLGQKLVTVWDRRIG